MAATIYKPFQYGVRIDAETSWVTGATEAGADPLGKVTNFSSSWTDGVVRSLGIGEGRNETAHTYGNVDITGTIDWEVISEIDAGDGGSINFMKFAIGKNQGSGSTAAPYELVEGDAIDYSTGFSFGMYVQAEAGTTDDVDFYSGCVASSLTLTGGVTESLKASMDFVAKTVTCAAAITTPYATPSGNPWMMQQGSLKWGATPTAVGYIQNFSITLNNNPVVYYSVGSRFIEQPEWGNRTYDFTITAKMTSTVATSLRDALFGQANSFIAGTDPSIRTGSLELNIEFTEGAGASGDKQLEIELDDASITSMSKAIPVGGGIVEVTFTGIAQQALLDSTDGVFIRYLTIT